MADLVLVRSCNPKPTRVPSSFASSTATCPDAQFHPKVSLLANTTYEACPTDLVNAPVDVVWRLLTNLSGWGDFYDVRVNRVDPVGPATVGQLMSGESGPRWLHLKVSFRFTNIDPTSYKLEFDVTFPFSVSVHEDLDCVPLDDGRCRVNYHCNFSFPRGWRGAAIRALLGSELRDGPADSLQRLKRAAEAAHRGHA